MAQAQSNTAPQGKSSKGASRVTRVLGLIAAGIVIVLAAAGALFQQPHLDQCCALQNYIA